MRRPWALVLLAVCVPVAAAAGKQQEAPPSLPAEHVHPSGAFTYRTPADWKVAVSPTNPNAIETGANDLLVRLIFRDGENGYDSLHVDCMLVRLAPEMEQEPRIRYQYDFVSGLLGNRRVLDSAFEVRYLKPIAGHIAWRQRNVTMVGEGQSLCAISYAPVDVWKKSKAVRTLLDAVLASVTFR